MSPTILKYKSYRFFFFSREEKRLHVHVTSPHGEAKFWIDPIVALEHNYRFSSRELREIQEIIEENLYGIKSAWKKYFKS
ncbi:MAG: hypothetical protein A2X28_05725 [Elusimicrobia bacterium GWA2_56_46]|nr:MAG: hypothetical protein A2X28_05725 [Elusimicrobia bacterium GWA2_56_46]OGR56022.1 MAG: hypothetical protein A2X39_03175 [Elusimicrobia bacterium GWC2_56_31]HBW23238.1 DUF4160 domain-containing protein [Elusimicrobiota bacterium]